jgi:putative Mg2+ transporter-C (MgtC) family protein
MQISDLQIMIRIGCAIFCGAAIGWERERREKAAGLRTHIFVCMGAALVMIVSAFGFTDALARGSSVLDPSRVAAQVISGVGFLGAGVIWFARNKVRGLDTAAGIWTTSAVGLAAGGALYTPALTVTAAILLMNMILKPVEQRFFRRRKEGSMIIGLDTGRDSAPESHTQLGDIRRLVTEAGLSVRSARLTQAAGAGTLGFDLNGPKDLDWLLLVERVQKLPGITSVAYNEPVSDGD